MSTPPAALQTPPYPDVIRIGVSSEGKLSTTFYPYRWPDGFDVVKVGVALASATRVITSSIIQELRLGEGHREQIEATIAEVYNRDLGWGDTGEQGTTKPVFVDPSL